MTEPQSTPNLAWSRSMPPFAPKLAYDKSAMNIDTVKPMPHTTHTLANAFHVAPTGSVTILRRIANHEKEKTPINLPMTNPNITAKLTPENSVPMLICERSIPALAKAKSGTTR